MNFDDLATAEQAQQLALPLRLITEEEQHRHRTNRRCMLIAEEEERLRREWARRFPNDVRAMEAFEDERAQRKFDRRQSRLERRYDKAERRAFILAQVENPTIPPDDPRWNDLSSSKPVSSSTENSNDYDREDFFSKWGAKPQPLHQSMHTAIYCIILRFRVSVVYKL
jgi:hypothetical protein